MLTMETNKPKKGKAKEVNRIQKQRPYTDHLRHTKIKSERCQKIRRFLKRQSAQTGRDLEDILSQSLSRHEVKFPNNLNLRIFLDIFILQVAKIIQLQSQHVSPENYVPSGLVSPPQETVEVKEEPQDEDNQVRFISIFYINLDTIP